MPPQVTCATFRHCFANVNRANVNRVGAPRHALQLASIDRRITQRKFNAIGRARNHGRVQIRSDKMAFFSKKSKQRAAELEEFLEYLRAPQEVDSNGYLEEPKDIEHESLRGAALSGADLRHANLKYVDLTDADLSGADLSNADLSWATLNRADLSGANLKRARMIDAMLQGANLTDADLSAATGLLAECLKGVVTSDSTKWPDGFSPAIRRQSPLLHDHGQGRIQKLD